MAALLKIVGSLQGKIAVAGASGMAAYGAYNWQQARQALVGMDKKLDEPALQMMFKQMDKDGNGTVDAMELQVRSCPEA